MRAIDGDKIVKILNECIDKIMAIQNLDITYNPKLSAELQVYKDMLEEINEMPTIEPERTGYIADTKALPSNRDCVDLSERVTATFYDDEHEEWSKKTVTIRDVLDSVCDDYTVIEPERKKGKWIERESGTEDKENGFETVIVCSCCDFPATTFYSEDCESRTQIRTDFCPNCGASMTGDKE